MDFSWPITKRDCAPSFKKGRVQIRAKLVGVGAASQAWLLAANSRIAVRRSSIRSCSASQNLSDERRREGVRSTSVVSSLAIIARRNVPGLLPDLRRLRANLDVRERVRFGRPALIKSFLPKS
jgi:hypothetical protein